MGSCQNLQEVKSGERREGRVACVFGRTQQRLHCPGSALLYLWEWKEGEKHVFPVSHSVAAVLAALVPGFLFSCVFVSKFRAKLYKSPDTDRMIKIEIIYSLVALFGSPWGFVCVHSFSSIWSLPGDLFSWHCATTLPWASHLANPVLPNQCWHLIRWTWPCGYQVLRSNVTDQIRYLSSNLSPTPAQVPVFCITPLQCAKSLLSSFSSCSCLKLHPCSADKLRLLFPIYRSSKNRWVDTLIKFPFSLHSLTAFLTLEVFFFIEHL